MYARSLALAIIMLPLIASLGSATELSVGPRDPYLGVIAEGEVDQYEYVYMPVKYVSCIDERLRLHRVTLYYDPPQDVLTLTVAGGGNLLRSSETAVGVDGMAMVEVLSGDSCPKLRITVEGTDVGLVAGYEVRVQPSACGSLGCSDPPSPLVFGRL